METLERKITIFRDTAVSSVWAVPEGYRSRRDLALIIAHGAGNDMHGGFVRDIHQGLAERGILTVKFNFPYKEAGRKAPDRAPLLEAAWRAAVEAVAADEVLSPAHLFLSGKSMGGRIATHLAAQGTPCTGIIVFGYPLHSADKPDRPRTEHFSNIRRRMLFLQGTRDPLCRLELLRPALETVPGPVELHVIEGGDHSFKVLKRSGRSDREVMGEILAASADWMGRIAAV